MIKLLLMKLENMYICSMKIKVQICFIAITILVGSSCIYETRKDDKLIAKVGDKRLYLSEMLHIFPKDCIREDSVTLAKLYIDNWIKTRLLLKKAELNLSSEDLNISKEIEKYRTDLLIYKYEDRMLQEKLDTIVYDSEIKRYYEANIANFSTDEYMVRAIFIKLPLNAPAIWNVRRWITSSRENDIQDLIEYCYKHSDRFNFYNDDWVLWQTVEAELPNKDLAMRAMRQNGRIEQQDERFVYMVHVKEKRVPGDPAPLAFVKNKVKSIIINKRKLKFISDLGQEIYNDALLKNQFEIY